MKAMPMVILGACLAASALAQAGMDLSGWQIAGAGQTELIQGEAIILPAGAQMVHRSQGGGITLRLISEPAFAADPSEILLLELGATALAFVRQDHAAVLKLLAGNREPEVLPVTWALDETDKLEAPLALEITQRGTALSITVQHHVLSRETAPLGEVTEIVLSAGVTQAWVIQSLAVSHEPVMGPSGNPAAGPGDADAANASGSGRSSHGPGSAARMIEGSSGGGPAADAESEADPAATAFHAKPALEVFTPPAVRRGRGAEIRALLGRRQLTK